MLNIPNSVKTLYQTDGVRKNFRVHFPNGEYADITNDNVVSESVKFTESLCSQSTFKFGLAEASVLEFETVGIANMYGMTIEASCEIDCSSLSAADKAAIAAGTWDGTWDAVNEVFAVPYGVFRVESCPRDHQSMAHRQVTAYGKLKANNPFETDKMSTFVPEQKCIVNAYYEMLALLGYNNKAGLLTLGFTQDDTTVFQYKSGQVVQSIRKDLNLVNGQGATVTYGSSIGFYYAVYPQTSSPSDATFTDLDRLYEVDLNGENYSNILSEVATALSLQDINLAASGYDSWDALATDILKQDLSGIPYIFPSFVYEYTTQRIGLPDGTLCRILTDNDVVYPYVGNTHTKGRFFLPTRVTIYDNSANQIYSRTLTRATVKAYISSTTPPSISLSIAETATQTLVGVLNTYSAYQHTGVDMSKFAGGYLEINAMFALLTRTGSVELVRLDNASPLSVLPSYYDNCWWDEYDIDPIGTVNITFQEDDGNGGLQENTAAIIIGGGASQYDMADNETLKNLSSTDLATVTNLINTKFKPYVDDVTFTPTELTMQGWPWLEAGDAIEITAEDGTTVETYALRIEMSGIQHLTSVITAEGGEIIEEVS